jgi:hypothetical protein
MKKLSLIATMTLLLNAANAQFISDAATNRPLYQLPADIQGTPFLNNNWSDGNIISESGVNYTKMRLKFDVFRNELVFNINDSSFRFNDPVKEFELTLTGNKATGTAKFIKSSLVHNKLPEEFVQELIKGKTGLYKHYKKNVVEVASYNMVGNKIFEDRVTFYILKNGAAEMVSLSKKTLQEMLADKWAQIDEYMQQNNLSAKNEAGWIAAIAYYNSL